MKNNETYKLYVYDWTAFRTEEEAEAAVGELNPWLHPDDWCDVLIDEIEVTKEEWEACVFPERYIKEFEGEWGKPIWA